MAQPSDFLNIITERGFVHQCTDLDGLKQLLTKQQVAYCGFDCTAPSLHVGSLMQIMLLRWFQKCGHKPIVLMGGGTTKVGDPSGKDESRKILADEEIETNMRGIAEVFGSFISFDKGPSGAVMVNNDEWLGGLKYIEFLRDYGRHFSVNRMIGMDSVKLRLERDQHLSFLEFNYMIMQAYDFLMLAKPVSKDGHGYGCRLQFGGSDQWGNIVMGVELQRRCGMGEAVKKALAGMNEDDIKESNTAWWRDHSVFGLTTPLITTSSGAKMGKTAAGAVWLDAKQVSPYEYWQFWRNTEDADVGRFLRFFTELPMDEIKRLEKLPPGPELNEAKKILANEATKLCHGETAAVEAADTARKTFEEGATGDALPTVKINMLELFDGIPAYKLFHQSGLAASGSEARRLIKGNGARVNDEPVTDENQLITLKKSTEMLKLSAGKKKHALIKPE